MTLEYSGVNRSIQPQTAHCMNLLRTFSIALLALTFIPAVAQNAEAQRGSAASSQELPDAPSAQKQRAAKNSNGSHELTRYDPYEPLSSHQKFRRFINHTSSPFTFASAALDATWLQINGEPYSYGGGVNGWMKRFGVDMLDTETRSFFSQYFYPSLLHQDPRYFPMRNGNVVERGWYAATRVLIGRADDGRSVFNSSYLFSVATSKAISTAYIPADQRDFRTTMIRILGAYGSDAGGYVLEEFWPDIMRIFHRHAPEQIKKIEQKIPPQIMGAPQPPPATPPSDDKCGEGGKCEPPPPQER